MNRNHFIYIVCGAGGIVLGWLFPLVFILLDLTQLGENIGWEQISFVTRSQDIYLFSFIVFPFVFSTLFISFRKVLVSKKELVKTHELLKQEEKKLIKVIITNLFRCDIAVFDERENCLRKKLNTNI